MFPVFLLRFSKMVLVSATAVAIGFGVVGHASAQKGNFINEVNKRAPGILLFGLNGREAVYSSISMALDAGGIDALKFKNAPAMQVFYAGRHNRPVWINLRGNNHDRAIAALHAFEKAWRQGLNPESYHVNEIRGLLSAREPARKAQLELLVSDAVIRYAQDLNGFHLPARAIRQDASYWRVPAQAGSILAAAATSDDIEKTLESYAPHDPLYKRLQEELTVLADGLGGSGDDSPLSFGASTLQPGEFHRNVGKLRARMGMSYNSAYGPENKYDDRLAASVMNFQRAHGLIGDGAIGPKTLALLNQSSRAHMEQIIANMERLRWINVEDEPGRYILVNIPSATLWAVDHGDVVLEMPVIVGRPERPTKSFITEITGIRFNPKWTVPPTIKAQDFLPKLMADPTYLQNKGIEVSAIIDGERQTLDSASIDWANIDRRDLAQLRMVQDSGDNNALGRIRVLMDNPYDIYLHDTNSPEYFSKTERTLSSGCIRLSDPEAVARFILANNSGWSKARMERILASGRTTEIPAAEKIPVYILYQTIWLDDQNRLVYGPDVYKLDHKMIEAMAALNVLHIPKKTDIQFASMPLDSATR
jgi:murein L,D-transpeptidase YcbB/YkuD